VNAVMNLRVKIKFGEFLDLLITVYLLKRTLLHIVSTLAMRYHNVKNYRRCTYSKCYQNEFNCTKKEKE
jgi:hypothetical protein